jgi:hypothetical protein
LHARHDHVGDEQVDVVVLRGCPQRLDHDVAVLPQYFAHGKEHARIVFSQKHRLGSTRRSAGVGARRDFWQPNGEGASGSQFALHAHPPLALPDDPVDSGESESRAFRNFLCLEERLKDPCPNLLRHAGAVIARIVSSVIGRARALRAGKNRIVVARSDEI